MLSLNDKACQKIGGRKMGSLQPKPQTRTESVTRLISSFYLSNDVSRMMPGRKDYMSVVKADGKRQHLQKWLVLLCNL